MTNELSQLQQQIQEALRLLQESEVFAPEQQNDAHKTLPTTDVFAEQNSLLNRCAQVCAEYQEQKPAIRIIHHPACSGGTLISKCIAAMPNIYLLSEVHPLSDMHISGNATFYAPSDLTTLSRFAGIPNINVLASSLFIQNVELIYQHLKFTGADLVLREHSHFDFFKGDIVTTPVVSNLLKEKFDLLQVVTLRNPIDCYLSLLNNNWLTFQPQTFDEYCRRYFEFIRMYSNVTFLKYEDFLEDPINFMINMCGLLKIRFSDLFINLFELFSVTGDSGRSGNTISKRDRRALPYHFIDEVKSSNYFKLIQVESGYPGL